MLKSPRLLPIVIAATTALLLLKGIGLVTGGGYVLTGTTAAVAAGGGGEHSGGAASTAAGVDPTMDLPEPETMTDESPTLTDTAPVLPLEPEGAAGGHGSAAEAIAEVTAGPPGVPGIQAACPPSGGGPAEAAAGGHGAGMAAESEGVAAPAPDCIPIPLNEHGDAIAMEVNTEGKLAPVGSDEGSEADLLSRLGERRDDLDSREKELEMRMALVEAAEKRIEERTAALKALEARIDALVEEKKSDEKEQFAGIVAMYETMKPKEAATIFNALDTQMLVRVARGMNPRKMAPILARMEPMKAKALTAGLAREEAEPKMSAAEIEDLANLPQIVGQ